MDELAIGDYFVILRRWKKIFVATTLVFLVIAVIFAMRWSNYRSTAVVEIEQPEISAQATRAVGEGANDEVEAMADQRISEIEQKVLSTASLIEIITKMNLYPDARQHVPVSNIAENMRRKIKIDLVSSTLANPSAAGKAEMSAIAFKLSFDYSEPLLTQQTTNEIVSRFLDEDLKARRQQTEATSAFLDAEIATMEQSMSEQEKKIADFQKELGTTRPESLAFNQQEAATIALNLDNLNSQITTLEGNMGSIRGQLASVEPYSRVISDGQVLTTPRIQLKALEAKYSTLTAQYGAEYPDVIKTRNQIAALREQVGSHAAGGADGKRTGELKSQITDVQTNLDAAKKTYGPNHPDVHALETRLDSLKEQLAAARNDVGSNDGVVADADNPAYLQLVSQLHAAQEQVRSLEEQRKNVEGQQKIYQKAITENPEAEKQMAALSRDYENAQQRYRELKEKKMAADMDVKMQEDRKGERLTLLDPPALPIGTSPGRTLILLGGLMVAFIAGSVSVLIAQLLSGNVIGARHLEAIVGVAPLVAIPHISRRASSSSNRKRRKILRAAEQQVENSL